MWRGLAALCVLGACATDPLDDPSPPRQGDPSNELDYVPGPRVMGAVRWGIALRGAGDDRGLSVVVHPDGDVVVCALVDGATMLSKRAAADGSEVWTVRPMNGSLVADIRDVAIAADGTIVVTGGTVEGLFVAKYSPAGALLWISDEPLFFEQPFGLKVVVDPEGRIFVMGVRYPHDSNDADIAVMAFSPSGATLWSELLQGADGPYGDSIAVMPNGDVLVAGTTLAPVYAPEQVLLPTSREQAFLSRWSNDGRLIESRLLGPAAPYVSFRPEVRVDGAGRIVVEEVERDETGPVTGPNAVGAQMVLRVLDEQMVPAWDMPIGNGYQGHTLALSASSIVASRWTDDPYNADEPGSVGGNMEVMGLDMVGHAAMSAFGDRSMGAPVSTWVSATSVGPLGEIAHTGGFAGTIDFGSGSIQSIAVEEIDAFVVLTEPPAL